GPLKVVAAQPPRDIHCLTDEVQILDFARLHAALVELVSIDPAAHGFRLAVTSRPTGLQPPAVDAFCQLVQSPVRNISQAGLSEATPRMLQPLFCQTPRPDACEHG